MKTIKNTTKCLSFFIALICGSFMYGQGATCDTQEPFCAAGSSIVFQNTSNGPAAETGPDYGCLASVPNPAWYYMQIDQSGDLFFLIEQNTQADFNGAGLDVDFIAWGPFTAAEFQAGACNNLTGANQVPGSWQNGDPPINTTTSQGCSYSSNNIESFNIIGANAGDYYIVVITNFSNQAGFIQVEQTNTGMGSGGTDCSIVNTPLEHCVGDIISLDGTFAGASSYEWYQGTTLLAETGPLLNNVIAPSDTYTVDKFGAAGGLVESEIFVVNFSDVPIANPVATYVLCDDTTADGMRQFPLITRNAQVLGGQAGMTVSYHISQMDADNNQSPLPNNYSNTTNPETIYVRIENNNNTDCYSTTTFNLQVDVLPTAATADDITVCDDLSNDGVDIFDLKLREATIIGAQNPLDITVTYHESMVDADGNMNPIATPGAFLNIGSPDTIFVRVENNANTTCYAVSSFNLIVLPLPPVVATTPLRLCDDATADGITEFDLTERDDEINGGNADITVDYFETLLEAQNNTAPIPDYTMYTNTSVGGLPANPQTVYVRVTDTSTTSNCFIINTLVIEVLENPTPVVDPADIILCDDNGANDMQEIFDLTIREGVIFNGEPYTATYHNSLDDANQDIGAIATPTAYPNMSTPETIYVRVENADGCHAVVDFDLIVNPLPETIAPVDLIGCELNTDGLYGFDLESKTDEILNGQSPAIFAVTYHETLVEAEDDTSVGLTSPYQNNLGNPQPIYVRITNTTTTCSISTMMFNIEVRNQPTATQPAQDYIICDDLGDNDGFAEFDLFTQDAEILNGQLPVDYSVTYFAEQMDAIDNVNALPNNYENTSNPEIIYARVSNILGVCYELAEVTLRVELIPVFSLEESYIICLDANGNVITTADSPPVIDTGLSLSNYDFEWSYEGDIIAGEIMPTLTATQAGNYSVTVSEIATGLDCMSTATTIVNPSSPPILDAVVVSDAFVDNHMIEATGTGTGVYEFSLDGGPWELGTDNGDGSYTYIFNNVNPPGEHTVTARDVNGCGMDEDSVFVFDYPQYFTPNNDGYNDTWNIIDFSVQPTAKIFIYDRYGKLLKQISPTGEGWTGEYNGEILPSSDYWFTVSYMEPRDGVQKQFKSHFTLKR